MKNVELAMRLRQQVKDKQISWKEAADKYYNGTGDIKTPDAMECFCRALAKRGNQEQSASVPNTGNTIEAIVEYSEKLENDKSAMLQRLGYKPDEWKFNSLSISRWAGLDGDVKLAVKYSVAPIKFDELTKEAIVQSITDAFKNVKPYKCPVSTKKGKAKLLMELPGMELHLGKHSCANDTGMKTDHDLLVQRFYQVVERTHALQKETGADSAVLYIGNDFFNSDTYGYTTTRGTQQQNDLSWKEMFTLGIKMYVDWVQDLISIFPSLSVRLVQGNHDTMASFYLYQTLKAYFGQSKVDFTDDNRETQAFCFGDCVIFTNHGTNNIDKRLAETLPYEYAKEWGNHSHRELHLGHTHHETVEEKSGIIIRHIGSPTGTDDWSYASRFIGSVQKYQIFIWDADAGLVDIKYIPFRE